MSESSAIPVAVKFENQMLLVTLRDGSVTGTPLNWYPRLVHAAPEQLNNFELRAFGIHREDLDEDLSVEGMLKGIRPGQPLPRH